jgi:hypothetical protein
MFELLKTLDWKRLTDDLHQQGYALAEGVLTADQCAALIASYNEAELYRKTINMERYRFGRGEYKYFNYPLPPLLQNIRQDLYPHLAPVANLWMEMLGMERRYPATLNEFHELCRANNQAKPTVLILKYGAGDYNTLHQDLYGDLFFPIQAVLFLNDPAKDYSGGELILTQQNPRAQSKATVIRPGLGDLLVFTTNFRPVKGTKGYYRVNVKHGVSEVHSGQRHSLGIIFHDAQN